MVLICIALISHEKIRESSNVIQSIVYQSGNFVIKKLALLYLDKAVFFKAFIELRRRKRGFKGAKRPQGPTREGPGGLPRSIFTPYKTNVEASTNPAVLRPARARDRGYGAYLSCAAAASSQWSRGSRLETGRTDDGVTLISIGNCVISVSGRRRAAPRRTERAFHFETAQIASLAYTFPTRSNRSAGVGGNCPAPRNPTPAGYLSKVPRSP